MSNRKPIKIDPGLATIIAAVIGAIVSITIAIVNNNKGGSSTLSLPSDLDYPKSSYIPSELSSSCSLSNLDDSIDNTQQSGVNSNSFPNNSSEDNSKSNDYMIISESVVPIKDWPYVIECEDGRAELDSDCSGTVYLYKHFLETNYIGRIISDDEKIVYWGLSFVSNNKSFRVNVSPICQNEGAIFTTSFFVYYTSYYVNDEYVRSYFGIESAKYTENGDLKIIFNAKDVPFDLTSSSSVNALFYTE